MAWPYRYCDWYGQWPYRPYVALLEPIAQHINAAYELLVNSIEPGSNIDLHQFSPYLDNCISNGSLNQVKVRLPYMSPVYSNCSTYSVLSEGVHDFNIQLFIDSTYKAIVVALNNAASMTIPSTKTDFFKYWWDQELDELKRKSCATHSDWNNAGRPKFGDIYDAKRIAKANYKKCINDNKKMESESVSNNLHDALIGKSHDSFWKIWKKKFSKNKNSPKNIQGLSDDQDIANEFAKFFSESCSNQTPATAARLSQTFTERLSLYQTDERGVTTSFDVELIDKIIRELKKGKAADIESLTAEHFLYCHPVVTCMLCKLFDLLLKFELVPDAFGNGITIPIPKKDTKSNFDKLADYRGITISPIISKIFELCILDRLKRFLTTSDCQFGFKKGLGCCHAIHTLSKSVEYFTSNQSTVNVCSLDLAKAFDRVNHSSLFMKLMDRDIPRNIILLLNNWYLKNYTLIKWGSCLSLKVKLHAGVRQGGVLSPYLFALLVDDVLVRMNNCGLGCRFKSLIVNAIMYADDLLLLSISLTDLQTMVNLCTKMFIELDLPININKSLCVRFGPAYKVPVANICIGDQQLEWKNELTFLGLTFYSANNMKCNFQKIRQKYFRALNSLFGKIGTRSSATVTLSLINSFCVPILAYGVEALSLNRSAYNALESAFSAAFSKIFNTYDKLVIKQCQFYCGSLPFSDTIDLRKLSFLHGLKAVNNLTLNALYCMQENGELASLLCKHKLNTEHYKWKSVMWNNFYASTIDSQ